MTVSVITDHVEQAVARLTDEYSSKPSMVGLISVLALPSQRFEDAVAAYNAARNLYGNAAVGTQLDALGELVGISREGFDDQTYLALIYGTIAKNNSDATVPAVERVARLVFQASAVYLSTPNSPGYARNTAFAELQLAIGDPTTSPALYNLLLGIVQQSIAAGVQLGSVCIFDASNALCCDGPQSWVAGLANEDGSGGGLLADVVYLNPEG